jgi:hypothetical protein
MSLEEYRERHHRQIRGPTIDGVFNLSVDTISDIDYDQSDDSTADEDKESDKKPPAKDLDVAAGGGQRTEMADSNNDGDKKPQAKTNDDAAVIMNKKKKLKKDDGFGGGFSSSSSDIIVQVTPPKKRNKVEPKVETPVEENVAKKLVYDTFDVSFAKVKALNPERVHDMLQADEDTDSDSSASGKPKVKERAQKTTPTVVAVPVAGPEEPKEQVAKTQGDAIGEQVKETDNIEAPVEDKGENRKSPYVSEPGRFAF